MKASPLPFLGIAFFGLLLAQNISHALAQNWVQTSAPNDSWTSVACSADGTKLIAVAYNGPMYISTNSGATYSLSGAPYTNWLGIAASAEGTKLLAVNGGVPLIQTNGQTSNPYTPFYVSTNSGATWTETNFVYAHWGGPVSSPTSVASSADGRTFLAAAPEGIYFSTNSGATWSVPSAPNVSWSSIACSANGQRCVATPLCFSICVSIDSGATWTVTGAPTNNWVSVATSADGTKLVAAANLGYCGDGLIYTSTNSGATWRPTGAPSEFWATVASSADGTRLVAASRGGCPAGVIYASTNAGATWIRSNVPEIPWWSVASSADGAKLVAAAWGSPIYTSQTLPSLSLNVAVSGSDLSLSWTVPSIHFVLQQNSDLRTTNWTDVATPPALNLTNLQYQVTVAGTNASRFYRLKAFQN